VQGQRYRDVFHKNNAVKLAEHGKMSVAGDSGVLNEVHRRWVKKLGAQPNEKVSVTPDAHAELLHPG
jgi:hypothetical protein